jgi:TonB family protein
MLGPSLAPRRGLSLFAAGALHAAAVIALAFATRGTGYAPLLPRAATTPRAEIPTRLVFLSTPGAGGGGGGGGNRQTGPIRQAHAPGHDAITLRVAKPMRPSTGITESEHRAGAVVLDAQPLGTGGTFQLGLPSGGVEIGTSLGPGSGGGVGTGTGTGIGSGTGPGLGPGSGGGTGGGVYRAGGGVTAPRVIAMTNPRYTEAALARRIQGTVELEVVVDRTGHATRIRVVRSLDPELDEQAKDAVAHWRFEPGRLAGTPVDVLATVVLDFRIH